MSNQKGGEILWLGNPAKPYIRVNGRIQKYYTGRQKMTEELRQAMENRNAPRGQSGRDRAKAWNDFMAPHKEE